MIDPEEPAFYRHAGLDGLGGECAGDLVEPLRIACTQQLFTNVVQEGGRERLGRINPNATRDASRGDRGGDRVEPELIRNFYAVCGEQMEHGCARE